MRRQLGQKLLGGELLLHEVHGLLHQQLGEPHRGGHLDPGLRRAPKIVTLPATSAAEIDHEKMQELGANRAPIPNSVQKKPRHWRGEDCGVANVLELNAR